MKSVIYKFKLELTPTQTIEVHGNKVLHVGLQGNDICLWMQVESFEHKHKQEFRCFETGEVFDENGLEYMGTVVLPNESVYHFFWVRRSN